MKESHKVLQSKWNMNFCSITLRKWCISKCIVNGYRFMYNYPEKYLNIVQEISDNEIWRVSSHFSKRVSYYVSNHGRVKSVSNSSGKETLLKPFTSNGYLKLNLYDLKRHRMNFFVHRLVAICFVPNPSKYLFVNHIDSVSADNFSYNLEWVKTPNEYNLATNIKLRNKKRSTCHIVATVQQICIQTGNVIKTWSTVRDVQKELGFNSGDIFKCCRGEQKTSKGFIWKFLLSK